MESGGSKAQRGNQLSRSGNPGTKQMVPESKGLWVSWADQSRPPTYPPSALARGKTKTVCNAEFRSGNSDSIFATAAGLCAGWWDLGPCPPRKAGGANPLGCSGVGEGSAQHPVGIH